MTALAFLRHGATDWNAARRIQGRADPPLSEAARTALGRCRLPEPFRAAPLYCSPLARARETASRLGRAAPRIEPRLIEADWGAYEGRTLEDLRAAEGPAFAAAESLGLDFRPPNGESPREVAARLGSWLAEMAALRPRAILAVTHKGVIRAALVLAYGWDMCGPPPVKCDWARLQVLTLRADGSLAPDCRPLALEEK